MKVNYRFLISAGFAFSLLSCSSTNVTETAVSVQNEKKNVLEAPVVAEPEPHELYAELLKTDVKLSVVSSPAAVNAGRKFSKPYVFAVKHADGSAYADFDVEIFYPASKNQDVEFKSEIVKTDAEGLVTFTPESASFAASTFVTAKPALLFEDDDVKLAADSVAVKAEYMVKSDIINKGAVLFIWDCNEKGRPVNNSTGVQSEFRTRGITLVGNGPVNDTSYIGKNSALYRDTYEIIGGDAYGYLISGTVKFVKPVEADGDEYVCSLVADITGIKMKDGSTVFAQTFTNEARGKNWNACTSKCKDELSKKIVDALVYGL